MSEKPESEEQLPGTARKRPPSFEEIMQGVGEEPRSAPKPAPARKPEKKSAQPTFEEILESAAPVPVESRPPPSAERKSRPPRQKDERKMPIVVRKPTLAPKVAAHS